MITLDEAIKYLKADKSGVVFNEKARQLGIEALEREKQFRQNLSEMGMERDIRLLPSEGEKE